VVYADVSEAET